jgi:hypothetical protein
MFIFLVFYEICYQPLSSGYGREHYQRIITFKSD